MNITYSIPPEFIFYLEFLGEAPCMSWISISYLMNSLQVFLPSEKLFFKSTDYFLHKAKAS